MTSKILKTRDVTLVKRAEHDVTLITSDSVDEQRDDEKRTLIVNQSQTTVHVKFLRYLIRHSLSHEKQR
jgi:hypothetical protein